MKDRARLLARFALLLVALVAMAAASACGRSSLETGQLTVLPGPDGGDPGAGCTTFNCAGCCSFGTCMQGTGMSACGMTGQACEDCTQLPGTACSPTDQGQACVTVNPPPACICPSGCCDANNVCRVGNDTFNCGGGNTTCADCSALGEVCDPNQLFCVAPGACGPCAGCCFGGQCVGGTFDTACGSNGNQCQNCSASGLNCTLTPKGNGGFCASVGGCDPTNCPGCCGLSGCVGGTDPSACSTGGQLCQACAGAASQCVPAGPNNGGICLTTGCNSQNCPGCCDGSGLCESGTSASSCGAFGVACGTCGANQACVSGACVTPTGCGPQTCAGCCVGSTCVGGGANNACGSGGGACQDCGSGAVCLANVCQTGGACNASNCPGGCCSGDLCLPGTNDSACGAGGGACAACGAGTQCAGGACKAGAQCSPSNCTGCCVNNQCVGGTNVKACGSGGLACAVCGPSSECVNGTCVPICGPGTCAGCCESGICALGGQNTACGVGGAACLNCAASGESCQNGACVKAACGPGTCAGCCDASGKCLGGAANGACGTGGAKCSNCTPLGDVCAAGTCAPPPPLCGGKTCPLGCCDSAGTCQDGFLGNQCGSGGASCVDCTALGSTCDVNVVPRVCSSQQTTCPAAYASCPGGTATIPPKPQPGACSSLDLTEAQAACAGGADSTGCQAFLKTLISNNAAACEACLQPFVVPFAQGTGIFLCVAPYVDASCNQDTGCYVDCETKSCAQCPAGQVASCQNQARTGNCSTYSQGLSCVGTAINGGGAFCNPGSYPTFGAWLKGVGGVYCQ